MIRTLRKRFIVAAMIAVSVLLVVLIGAINIANYLAESQQTERFLQMVTEEGSGFPEDGNGFSESGNGAPEDGESFPESGNGIPENGNSSPEDGASAPEDGNGFPEDGNGILENGNSSPEDGASAPEDGKSFPENGDDAPMAVPRDRWPAALFDFPRGVNDVFFESYFLVRFDGQGNVVYTDVSRIRSVDAAEAEEYARQAASRSQSSFYGREGVYRYRVAYLSEDGGCSVAFMDCSGRIRSILRVLFLSVLIGALCWLLMFLLVLLLSERSIRPVAESMQKQKRFVTDAGHEIKTPLAIILANTDALELHEGSSRWSRNIRMQAERLSGLMQNLLALAKMDEGGSRPAMEELCVSDLLRETVESFCEPAAAKGISCQTDVVPGQMMTGNRQQLAQLFSILSDNAVKYTEEGGSAEISLRRTARGFLLVRFRNTFSGEPSENPEKWFDRFYREDSARTQKSGGYGIGLSVARAVAEAHRGSIEAGYEEWNPERSGAETERRLAVAITVRLRP